MATYNKRGYKAPKPKEEKDEQFEETFDGNSTTANVFNKLDETASKTEEWVERNQKIIFVIVALIALGAVGYLLYDRVIKAPKEEEAANDMFQAEEYFNEALNAQKSNDSLYNLALNGGEGKMGFLSIIEDHSGTDAANLSQYYAGMAYLNLGKYKEAVEHLQEFTTKDGDLDAMAKGGIGDAFAQLKQNDDALEYYDKAVKANDDALTTPHFLLKAGQTALALNKKDQALKYFQEIKDKYETTPEGVSIDQYIALAQ